MLSPMSSISLFKKYLLIFNKMLIKMFLGEIQEMSNITWEQLLKDKFKAKKLD